MARHTKEERDALAHAAGNAALDKARALLGTDKEAIRATFWNGLPLFVREVAVHAAGLPFERATQPLSAFNAQERGFICLKVQRLIQKLEVTARCMQGGTMPDKTGGDRAHAPHADQAPGRRLH